MLSQSSPEDDPNTIYFNETLENTKNLKTEGEMHDVNCKIEQPLEVDSISEFQDYKSLEGSEDYEDEELMLPTESSESEPEELPAKRSRTNPLTLKRNVLAQQEIIWLVLLNSSCFF